LSHTPKILILRRADEKAIVTLVAVNQKRKDDENRNNYLRDERSLRPGSKHMIREKSSNEKKLSYRHRERARLQLKVF
jgi:hypothetical protein